MVPIGIYWLALAGVAHAVIEHTRHPAEPVATSEAQGANLPLMPLVQEPAAPDVPAESAPVAENEPAPLAVIPQPIQDTMPPEPPPRAPEPEPEPPMLAAASEREPLRQAPSHTTSPDVPARPLPAQPTPRRELTSLESLPRESKQEPPERSVLRRPEPSEEALPKTALPSCEAAAESAQETIDLRGSRGAPDLTRGAFAAVLENGAYLARCSIPERTALDICAAVQDGKVVGVSVRAEPANAAISSCVRRAVAALRFPQSARLDITRTRFEAVR